MNQDLTIATIAGILLLLMLICFIITFFIINQRKKEKLILEKQKLTREYEQAILQTQLEIQEQTLKNISQEIHDNIGQVLSLAKLNINTMGDAAPELLNEKISDSRQLISKAIQDLRDLSKSLNTDYVTDMGLARSIEYELELIKKTGAYEIELDVKGKPYRLEQQQELIFFRIVQEALHNIIKHAKATAINVRIMFEPEVFTLQISDNGAGFDAKQLDENNYTGLGLGIRNMHNRANMISAGFKLTSTLEKGTTVILTLPLQTPKL